ISTTRASRPCPRLAPSRARTRSPGTANGRNTVSPRQYATPSPWAPSASTDNSTISDIPVHSTGAKFSATNSKSARLFPGRGALADHGTEQLGYRDPLPRGRPPSEYQRRGSTRRDQRLPPHRGRGLARRPRAEKRARRQSRGVAGG